MRARMIIGVLSAAVLLAGCGGDDDSDDSGSGDGGTAVSSTAAPAPPTTAAPAGPDLVARGVTIEDVPEGFGPDPTPPDPATVPACIRDALAVFTTDAAEKHEVHFSYGAQGPYIWQTLGRFDPAAATRAVADEVAAFRRCPGVGEKQSPGVGDESHLLRVDAAGIGYDIAVFRVGDLVSTVAYFGPAGFDDSEQAVLYRLAAGKLQ